MEVLDFDAKVASLLEYGQALTEPLVDFIPHRDGFVPGLDKVVAWYSTAGMLDLSKVIRSQRTGIQDAPETASLVRAQVAFQLGNHARAEYGAQGRGFSAKDLREDTVQERSERSRILAVMTRPADAEDINERADMINSFMNRMLAGRRVEVMPYGKNGRGAERQVATVDTNRAVFGVFQDHVSRRTLYVQYNTPIVSSLYAAKVLALPLHRIAAGEGVAIG
jgi:hypothetical protein